MPPTVNQRLQAQLQAALTDARPKMLHVRESEEPTARTLVALGQVGDKHLQEARITVKDGMVHLEIMRAGLDRTARWRGAFADPSDCVALVQGLHKRAVRGEIV